MQTLVKALVGEVALLKELVTNVKATCQKDVDKLDKKLNKDVEEVNEKLNKVTEEMRNRTRNIRIFGRKITFIIIERDIVFLYIETFFDVRVGFRSIETTWSTLSED